MKKVIAANGTVPSAHTSAEYIAEYIGYIEITGKSASSETAESAVDVVETIVIVVATTLKEMSDSLLQTAVKNDIIQK